MYNIMREHAWNHEPRMTYLVARRKQKNVHVSIIRGHAGQKQNTNASMDE